MDKDHQKACVPETLNREWAAGEATKHKYLGGILDEMWAHRNNCTSMKCIRCVHAERLWVESSTSYVRCGCLSGKNKDTWSMWHYMSKDPPDECPDFCEVTDVTRKRKVNLAWEIACDRKMTRNPHTVCIAACHRHGNGPFPEVDI